MAEVEASDTMPCETFLSMYSAALKTVKSLINIPRKVLRKIQDMLDYPFNRANKLIDTVLDDLTNFNSSLDLGVTDFVKSLKKLISCPLIADSALGKQAATLIDMLLSGLTGDSLMQALKSAIKTKIAGVLDKFKSLVDNSIGSLQKKYNALLDSCGITSALKTLGQLETCIADLCAAYTAAKNMGGKIVGYFQDDTVDVWDTLKKTWDSAKGKVVDAWDATTEAAKDTSDNFTTEYEKLQTLYNNSF